MDKMNMPSPSPSANQAMVFTTSTTTPLYSSHWTPSSTSQYAGTCLFLVLLALCTRLLSAYRHILEQKIHDRAVRRRYIRVACSEAEGEEKHRGEEEGKEGEEGEEREKSGEAMLTYRGVDERVRVVRRADTLRKRPWRVSTDAPRAVGFVVQAGMGYLLMLAIMTMNVGYLLSVLAGLFVGELAVGRYSRPEGDQH